MTVYFESIRPPNRRLTTYWLVGYPPMPTSPGFTTSKIIIFGYYDYKRYWTKFIERHGWNGWKFWSWWLLWIYKLTDCVYASDQRQHCNSITNPITSSFGVADGNRKNEAFGYCIYTFIVSIRVTLINRIVPRIPVQIHPAPIADGITRHELAELRVVEPVPQQVQKARVLVPVAELRSHSVVQIIADAGIAMGELNPLDKILHKPKSLF